MIRFEKVKKIYNISKTNEFEALHNISMKIEDGELVAITGKSGAGKSTILHILACIDSYEEGSYYMNDILVKNLSERELAEIRNEKIGIVMQDYALVEDFTALENVMLPLDFSRKKKRDKRKQALDALESVDMVELAGKMVSKMSGGQKQRVAIARAIVNNPGILLADEPTGALDSNNSDSIMGLFKKINQQGRTVIIVTHDHDLAKQCMRTINIADGHIISM